MHSDDLLVTFYRTNLVMKVFDTAYTLKPDANGKKWYESTTYLRANIAKFRVPDTGKTCWSMSGNTYTKEAIKNIELKLAKSVLQMFITSRLSINLGCQLELDMSPVLEDSQANYYQNTVGRLRWAVNIGRIDINL